MTDYYGAFSASTSNLPGQIQSIIIDTSSKRILTCLYNNEKNLKNSLSKMLPRLCSPPTPLMGLSYGEQSLCRVPPSPVHPHEGAPMHPYCNFFTFETKSLICCLVGVSSSLTRCSLVLVPSLFSFLCCCKCTLFVSKIGKRVELGLFWISINLKLFIGCIFR